MSGEEYCSDEFRSNVLYYLVHVHGYLSLTVCLFGVVANLLNVLVLNQRKMVSPTNIILTGLAVADSLVMLDYVPQSYKSIAFDQTRPDAFATYPWAALRLFHHNFYQVSHGISIWLTVTLAVWRYLVVCWPIRSRYWCTRRRTVWAVLMAYICVPVLCIPSYLTYTLVESKSSRSNATIYRFDLSSLAFDPVTRQKTALYHLNFWLLGALFKLAPCLALTFLSLRLTCALVAAKHMRRVLTNSKAPSPDHHESATQRQMDRTTRMLLTVLLFFLVTEFPQGILALLAGTLDNRFFDQCYRFMTSPMDMAVLVNCAVNFLLYCCMSKEFRMTFKAIVVPRVIDKWVSSSTTQSSTKL